ncbi:MAG: hypothetical protein ABIB93_06775 [Chloroflexota bacterium]
MKKLTILFLTMVLVFSLAAPVMAADVTTDVTVNGGTGLPPIVKCKWELPDDGDPTHIIPGTQVLPPVAYGVEKPLEFFAVVTDPDGQLSVDRVYADVFHPMSRPASIPEFKYQLAMIRLASVADGLTAFDSAVAQGIITFNPSHPEYDAAEVRHELEQGLAWVWMGNQVISYHQPWGDYRVEVKAYDKNNNPSPILVNYFRYMPVTACEYDFTNVGYGPVEVCTNKWVPGDVNFGTAALPTVRNIGNTWLNILTKQDDMGFGDTSGIWNVEFDARLGAAGVGTDVIYNPAWKKGTTPPAGNWTMLPDILELCNTQKLDFSIHVKKADPASYSGNMILSCIYAAWP